MLPPLGGAGKRGGADCGDGPDCGILGPPMTPKSWVSAAGLGLVVACGTPGAPAVGGPDRATRNSAAAPEIHGSVAVQAPASEPPALTADIAPAPPTIAANSGPAIPTNARSEPSAPTAEQSAALALLREERIFGSPVEHFTVSNEYRHDVWFAHLAGLGGGYVGVASDQNYTLIAAARSEVAFLVDIDRQVVDLHAVYAALIAAADDPEAFLGFFRDSASARKAARQTITAALQERPSAERSRTLALFEDHREVLADYLKKVRGQTGSWLADPAAYSYVRTMFATGRIRVLQGNLMGRTTMASIAESARALGVPVKVLYLSNAEDYLFYGDRFADNVRALPIDDDSVALRTIHERFEGWESVGKGDWRWNYQVHSLADFQRRLGDRARGKNHDRTAMLADAHAEGAIERVARGVSTIARASRPPAGELERRDLPAPQVAAAAP
jgi:hypothetical protein